jgi:predicted phage terminase large subunit-like protein
MTMDESTATPPYDRSARSGHSLQQAQPTTGSQRSQAKTDLLTFATSIAIPGVPFADDDVCEEFLPLQARFGKHHLLWLDCLQRVEDGEIRRLMGLMPPGSAKSTYTSIVFPVHVMGRFPRHQVIVANYGSELPRKWGRKARSIVRQKAFKDIFGASLSKESAAADEWALTNGSEYMGAGVFTGITGNRADGVVWDDLFKGREQADSQLMRQKTWDAYVDDLLTRKKRNAWEIGITTRWHEDDIAGRILPAGSAGESGFIDGRDGNRWYVVCIPAEAEREDDVLGRKAGELFWPEGFDADHFATFKRNPRTWAALYQQRPAPEEGNYFQSEWLRVAERVPRTLRVYGASDYAVTAGGGDYTVHAVVGLDGEGRMYLLDLWRKQSASGEWVEAFCDLVERWKPIGWAEEQGQISAGIGPFLQRRMRERETFVARTPFPARGDKAVRAQSIRGRMASEGLYIPSGSPWWPDFRSELLSFPAGRHDDQVDAIGLVGQLLDTMVSPAPPKPVVRQRPDRWDRLFAEREVPSWKTV